MAAITLLLLQTNANYCRAAQDLLAQTAVEKGVDLTVVAEPYTVPDSPAWFGDKCGSVAIYWRHRRDVPVASAYQKGR